MEIAFILFAAGGGLLSGFVMGVSVTAARLVNRHKHQWKPTGVQNLKRSTSSLFNGPITVVLEVCTLCGASDTSELEGHWTLEQLKAPDVLGELGL